MYARVKRAGVSGENEFDRVRPIPAKRYNETAPAPANPFFIEWL
jgi:hypothetical protein